MSLWKQSHELELPLGGNGPPPREEIVAALERMGCLVEASDDTAVVGQVAGSATVWGQVVTVTIAPDRLHVRSEFSRTQLVGGKRNQENVERFRTEWERRAEFRVGVASPATLAAAEEKARKTARDAVWTGGCVTAIGAVLVLAALLAPTRQGAPLGSRLRFGGLSSLVLLYGLPRLVAGWRRLRSRPPADAGDAT